MTQEQHTKPKFVDNRYKLHELIGSGAMGAVYLATDMMNNQTVALKIVRNDETAPDNNSANDTAMTLRYSLTNEFRMLSGMRHPHIISVLDYGFTDDDAPYYVMEYLPDARSILDVSLTIPLENKITLLIQTLQAMEYLHRRNVLHRDLKPDNILVLGDNVKVLDFGISVLKSQIQDSEHAGTLAYMSPEALNDITNINETSDLWAIGLIAYEMLSEGQYPFNMDNIGMLIQQILFEEPDMSPLNVDDHVRHVVERMLSKDPQDRYAHANVIIQQLLPHANDSVVLETEEIREAFLQTAPFVGRTRELNELVDKLKATQSGQGEIHLISGVSGVGKSRLLDEVRVNALVRGVLVLRGQATQVAVTPYAMWQTIVKRLVLIVNPPDEQLSILKTIVPDIETFLDRPIIDPPDLNNDSTKNQMQAEQRRLFDAVQSLFRQVSKPMLLLMEDLHWADSGSLELLSYLSGLIQQHATLILGSYRSDEAPDLPEKFPDASITDLSNMDNNVIRELARSMLGEAGERQGVIELLNRESEGNVFFLVETIRELAQHSGRLTEIGLEQFPERIFPHGIADIVRRRLSKIEPQYITPLRLAAVSGRELDLNLLQSIKDTSLSSDWLTVCNTYTILEVTNGEWRFAHSKIRDGILADIPTGERQTLHRQMAEAKIAHYDGGTNHEASIAQHWEEAHELSQAGEWYFKAAEIARKAYATATSITYYEKANQYLVEDNPTRILQICEGLGTLYCWQTKLDDAEAIFSKMLTLAQDNHNEQAIINALLGLCLVYRDKGQYEDVTDYAQQVVERITDTPTPELATQKATALTLHAFALHRGRKFQEAMPYAQASLDLAEQYSIRSLIARNHSTIGILNLFLGDTDASEKSLKLSLSIVEELGDRRDIGIKNNNLGEFYRYTGKWEDAGIYLKKAVEIYEDIGAQDGWTIALSNLAGVDIRLNHYEQAEAKIRQIFKSLKNIKESQLYTEATTHLIAALYHQDKFIEASEYTQELLIEAVKKNDTRHTGIAWYYAGLIAWQTYIPFQIDEDFYTVDICFSNASEKLDNQAYTEDRAQVLRDWAMYEHSIGNMETAVEVRDQAIPLLMQLNQLEDVDLLHDTIRL